MTVWATGTGTNPHSVGINLFLTNGTYVNWELRVRATYAVSQNQSGSLWGAASWSGGYRKEGPGEVVIAAGGFWGTRGTQYNFGGRISGIYGNNNNVPDVYASILVPVSNPEPPSAPGVSLVGTTTARFTTNTPNGNGAAIDRWAYQRSTDAGFNTGLQQDEWAGNVRDLGGFAPNTQYWMRTAARNTAGLWSGYSAGTPFTTTPELPNAPTAPTVVRNSDTSQTVGWTRQPTAARPWDLIGVSRWDNDSGTWVQIATVSGNLSSYTDTTTVPDRLYQYAVWANNRAGNSGTVFTGNPAVQNGAWATTPKAPGALTATKAGADIVLEWSAGSTYGASQQIEVWHAGNGVWDAAPLATLAPGAAATYTHAAPSAAVTHSYRIRGKSLSPVLTGDYSVSNTVQLAAPPNAPTITGPTITQDAAQAMTLEWLHNPVDSSAQRQRQVRYRLLGSPTWTTLALSVSAVQSWTFAAATWTNGQTVEFQVLTYGQHATASPWSPTFTVSFSAAPTATISAPAVSITTPTTNVTWGYYQANSSPQAAWEIELLDGTGTVVERRPGSGAATTQALTTTMGDSTSWTVRIRVLSAAGRWSAWATRAFTVAYPLPAEPTVGLLWDQRTASVAVTVNNPATGVPVIRNDLYRRIDGGAWERIATGIPNNATVVDRECVVAGLNEYYATAWTALPSTRNSAVAALPLAYDHERGRGSVWISGGDAYEIVCQALYNVVVEDGLNRERVINRYEGRRLGMEVSSEEITRTAQVSFTVLPKDKTTPEDTAWDAWLVLAALRGPHLWRDKAGRRFYGTILGEGPRLRLNRDGTYRGQIMLEETEKP